MAARPKAMAAMLVENFEDGVAGLMDLLRFARSIEYPPLGL
jgi:hypothetical protein